MPVPTHGGVRSPTAGPRRLPRTNSLLVSARLFLDLWLDCADLLVCMVAADKDFNQAIMAIERYDVPWDFGPLQFNTIKIVSSDPTGCT